MLENLFETAVQAHTITIEVNMTSGGTEMKSFIVGLPIMQEKARQRIETAKNGFRIPRKICLHPHRLISGKKAAVATCLWLSWPVGLHRKYP